MANTISDKLTYLEGTKSAIKDAIVAKGVAVSDSDTFRSYADKIGQISGGGGGKINLNDYGLTFSNSKMDKDHYDNVEYEIPQDCSYWFHMASFQDPIDISDHINPDILYAAERTFQYARNIHINEIKLMAERSYTFSSFAGSIDTLEFINTLSPSWGYCTRTFYLSSSFPKNITITNKYETSVCALEYFFNQVTTDSAVPISVPEIEVINGQVTFTQYFSSYSSSIKSIGKIKLTNCSLYQDLNKTALCGMGSSVVTYFGGVEGADKSMNLANFRALNSQSVTDIITNVSDLTGKDTKTLTFYTNIYNALTEEQKSLATSKNWTLASSN